MDLSQNLEWKFMRRMTRYGMFSQEFDSVFNNDSIEEDNFVVSKSTLKENIKL